MQAERRIRNLVVQRIAKEQVDNALSDNERTDFLLAQATVRYEEWTAVSHTFHIQDDGSAVLTILFEQPV